MKVKELVKYLEKQNQEGQVYLDLEDDLVDICEITDGKWLNKDKTITNFVAIAPLYE